jgi:hypothetical protein
MAKQSREKKIEYTSDGHYIIVNGRRWRTTDPRLDEETRQQLVNELMQARREIAQAHRTHDATLEADARQRVHRAKVTLGERGTPWWERPEPGVDSATSMPRAIEKS